MVGWSCDRVAGLSGGWVAGRLGGRVVVCMVERR